MIPGVVFERLASVGGIDDVLQIDRESFSNPWTREMYECELQNDQSYVVIARDAGGQGIGYCSFWIILDEVHINNVAVRPSCARRGVGRALVEHALAIGHGRGAASAVLEVRRSNEAAQRLYLRLGFVERGVRHRYYSDPEDDALVLWAPIRKFGESPAP